MSNYTIEDALFDAEQLGNYDHYRGLCYHCGGRLSSKDHPDDEWDCPDNPDAE